MATTASGRLASSNPPFLLPGSRFLIPDSPPLSTTDPLFSMLDSDPGSTMCRALELCVTAWIAGSPELVALLLQDSDDEADLWMADTYEDLPDFEGPECIDVPILRSVLAGSTSSSLSLPSLEDVSDSSAWRITTLPSLRSISGLSLQRTVCALSPSSLRRPLLQGKSGAILLNALPSPTISRAVDGVGRGSSVSAEEARS